MHSVSATGLQKKSSRKSSKSPSAKNRQAQALGSQKNPEQAEESIPEELEAPGEPPNGQGGSRVTSKYSTPVNF